MAKDQGDVQPRPRKGVRCALRRCFSGLCFWAFSGPCVRAQKRPKIGDNEREGAEMVTEITNKHGDRKIRVHSGSVEISGSLHFSGRHI
jgi:hypothetical protein